MESVMKRIDDVFSATDEVVYDWHLQYQARLESRNQQRGDIAVCISH